MKEKLIKKDIEINTKTDEIKICVNQLSENDCYILKLETRISELLKEKKDSNIIRSNQKTDQGTLALWFSLLLSL